VAGAARRLTTEAFFGAVVGFSASEVLFCWRALRRAARLVGSVEGALSAGFRPNELIAPTRAQTTTNLIFITYRLGTFLLSDRPSWERRSCFLIPPDMDF